MTAIAAQKLALYRHIRNIDQRQLQCSLHATSSSYPFVHPHRMHILRIAHSAEDIALALCADEKTSDRGRISDEWAMT